MNPMYGQNVSGLYFKDVVANIWSKVNVSSERKKKKDLVGKFAKLPAAVAAVVGCVCCKYF